MSRNRGRHTTGTFHWICSVDAAAVGTVWWNQSSFISTAEPVTYDKSVAYIVVISYIVFTTDLRMWLIKGINVKKLQFIHKLTASDTSKTAKSQKGDITHQHIA